MSVLDGKVAIVTGAGRGLGRVEALELSKLGARIVVNDLGTKSDGSGKDEDPAREVVEEIKKAGGEAVAHFGDVADWNDSKSMFETAISEFGELNILVNNAGFCRDKMIFNMEEDEFDTVLRVHVKGHFLGMRNASVYWRGASKEKGGPVYGRVISGQGGHRGPDRLDGPGLREVRCDRQHHHAPGAHSHDRTWPRPRPPTSRATSSSSGARPSPWWAAPPSRTCSRPKRPGATTLSTASWASSSRARSRSRTASSFLPYSGVDSSTSRRRARIPERGRALASWSTNPGRCGLCTASLRGVVRKTG